MPPYPSFPEPDRVVVAGDWHRDTAWGSGVIRESYPYLKDEPFKLFLHLGDFMGWNCGDYLDDLNDTLRAYDSHLWFLDGNHEDFPLIAAFMENTDALGMGTVRDRIRYLPRGYRWTWHDRVWMALGGAVSVDKDAHTEGKTWWPDEEITMQQAVSVMDAGHADVVLSHDCPSGVPMTLPPPAKLWLTQIDRAQRHRQRLQEIFDVIRPAYSLNGHYHMAWSKTVRMPWGPMRSTGLDCNRGYTNFVGLDTRTMEMESL